jgi:integrase
MGPRVMRRLPRYVHGYLDRHGKPRHYLRQPSCKEVPLPGMPWSTEFMDAYEAAMSSAAPIIIGAKRSAPGTVAEAVARYLGSAAFVLLAPSTQAMRRAILERFRNEHGDKRLRKLQTEHVVRILGKLRPYAQRNMLKTLRGFMAFALSEKLNDLDPTAGVKLAKVKDTGGFETWPVEAIERYRRRHKLGTRSRLALELLYGTMAARGDVVRLGRQHVQSGGFLSFRRGKTRVQVDIPVLPELQVAIDAMPKAEHLTFLVTEFGKPFSAAGFGNWFRDQCDLADVADLSAHGLRKAGATRFAEHGATDHEIMAWGGWKTLREVQRYTAAARRKLMALRAADRLKGGTELANLETRFANEGEKS